MKWRFQEIKKGMHEQAPIEEEFFTGKGTNCDSLVREAIQNSLDAKSDKSNIVKVKFCLGVTKYKNIKEYFKGLSEHIKAMRNQKEKECLFEEFTEGDHVDVHYLIIEDFGTTGLDGEVCDGGEKPPDIGKSNFYDFVYRTGYSGKEEEKAGRWGVGKAVFNKISKIKTIFGVTHRKEDNKVFMFGKSVLKAHNLGDKRYDYMGIFEEDDGITIQNKEYINKFIEIFGLKERTEYPGLSIVIPYYKSSWDEEDEENKINSISIKRAVIKEFFYTILTGNLEVDIVDEDKKDYITLNKHNIISEMNGTESCLEKDIEDEERGKYNFIKFFEDVEEAKRENAYVTINIDKAKKYQVDEKSFNEDDIDKLKEAFSGGKLLSFRIPITIPFKHKQEKETYFDVYIKKIEGFKEPHRFWYRSGIRIKNEKYNRSLGSRGLGLLVVEDSVMSSFLGDAETPAHDKWEFDEEKIKEKYGSGAKDIIKSVIGIFGNISRVLGTPTKDKDWNFLSDIFFIEEDEELEEEPKEKSVSKPQVPSNINRKLELVEVSKNNNGGFIVRLKSDIRNISSEFVKAYFPFIVRIVVAYDTVQGNPFRKYETLKPYDFDFSKDTQFKIMSIGCEIEELEKNRIKFRVLNTSFSFSIEGFDKNRDLALSIDVEDNE